jgi:hypothetical protein
MKQDDDDIQDYESSGWRKKQIQHQLFPMPPTRNEVLEEVAHEFDMMRIAFGDTAASFAQYVREMKE